MNKNWTARFVVKIIYMGNTMHIVPLIPGRIMKVINLITSSDITHVYICRRLA